MIPLRGTSHELYFDLILSVWEPSQGEWQAVSAQNLFCAKVEPLSNEMIVHLFDELFTEARAQLSLELYGRKS